MENNGLGPLPAQPSGGGLHSPARAALLETVRAQSEPVDLKALVSSSGRHQNTVREHLDGLVDEGLVERHRAVAKGRGRPAWLYVATLGPSATPGNEYAGLASALARVVERTSADPERDAAEAGFEWGRTLANDLGAPSSDTAAAARRQVLAILDKMGFAPQSDRRGVETLLRRCPLLQAAQESPTVVCHVHLGIVRGAMAAYGQTGDASELHPFSDPGSCRLRLVAGPARSQG